MLIWGLRLICLKPVEESYDKGSAFPGGGGGTAIYGLYIWVLCRCEGYGFQAVYSRIGYITQSVWV